MVTGTGPTGYCLKCKGTKQIKGAKVTTLANGTPAVKGSCPDCNSSVVAVQKGAKAKPKAGATPTPG